MNKINEKPVPTEPTLIDCEICFNEIPDTVAMTEEGEDYVAHFCGLDCYAAWKKKREKTGITDK